MRAEERKNQLLDRLIDGSLNKRDRNDLQRYLKDDPEYKRSLQQLNRIWLDGEQQKRAQTDAAFEEAAKESSTPEPQSMVFIGILAAVACYLITLFLFP